MARFNMNNWGKPENKLELGKTEMNEASLKQRDKRKKTEYIHIADIIPNPDNRLSMNTVDWLVQDIQRNGLLQPLVVQQQEDGKYMLYGGHQRFEAIKQIQQLGKWPKDNLVEVKVIDMDDMNVPDGVSQKTREKMALRSLNIQRDKTDADMMVEIQDWKEIYADLRANGVEVYEFGTEDGEESFRQQIKGVKTQKLVAEQLGISPAQVAKFDKVQNQGSEVLIDALKEDKVSVAVASSLASKPVEEQEKIVKEVLERKEEGEKITGEDVVLAEERIERQKDSKHVEEQSENAEGDYVSLKDFKKHIKPIEQKLKENSQGIVLDERSYSLYLKHIKAIQNLFEKAQ